MSTVVSAPGKVLIAGGYLVLDPKYSGIVVATSSRFYSVVKDDVNQKDRIRVRSPQFVGATWSYSVGYGETITVNQLDDLSTNKFVHKALQNTIQLAYEIKGADVTRDALATGLDITIVGDNDFYSQRAKLAELGLSPTLQSLSQIEPFVSTGVNIADVHKTGLGSSAALITSLVSSLLVHLSAIPTTSLDNIKNEGRVLAHNTAQFIHCLAQGKVGSGFDVSSAAFGSQRYTRFDPGVIQGLMADNLGQPTLFPTLSPENKAWDYRVDQFKLPPLVRIMLADVDAGSDTPSLVGKVLKWRKAESDFANQFWDDLGATNDSLAKALVHISDLHAAQPAEYSSAVKRLSNQESSQWLVLGPEDLYAKEFFNVHKMTEVIRSKMREMGQRSGVPIEPPEQTELLDACISQPGVIGGGVPGAGGYDAIWVLVFESQDGDSDEQPLHRVEKVWSSWTKLNVSPLSASESFELGVRLEDIDQVKGLRKAVG